MFVLFAGIASVPVCAQRIPKFGVVDLSRIYSLYFRESQAVRELEDLRQRIQKEIDARTSEIQSLESRKLDAETSGNETLALQLDNQIYERKRYLNDYIRIKNAQLQEQRDALTESSGFLAEIVKGISYVAESEGYSAILKSSDADLVWWHKEVDITDKVIEYLVKQAGKR